MTVVNDDTSSGDFKSRLYIASVATDSTSVPTWTQLNASAPWNGQSITGSMTDTDGNSVSAALSVRKGGAFMTKHVWVCKDRAVHNSFGCDKIVIYDMNDGIDTMNATLANLPGGVVDLQAPHYCPQSAAWFVPYNGGMLKSTDGGLNWSKKEISVNLTLDGGSTVIGDWAEMNSVSSGTNGTLVAVGVVEDVSGTDYGVITRSEDDGETWQIAALNANKLFSVEVAGHGIWVVGGENNLLGASLDDGYVWGDLDYVDNNNPAGQTITAIHYGGLHADAPGNSQPASNSGVTIPSNCLLFLDASDTNSYDGYGTAWYDLSSEGNNATLVNSPTYNGSDKVFDFAGSNSQYATVGSGFSDFSSGASFFFVADLDAGDNWERLIDFSTGGRSSNANVRNAGSPINVGRTSTGTGMTIGVYDPNKQEISSDMILNNTLASYCVTIDGTNAKFYRNGTLQQTVAYSYLPQTETRTNNYIGQSRNPNDAYFDGQIGVIGIFDRDLSETEVSDLHDHYKTIYSLD